MSGMRIGFLKLFLFFVVIAETSAGKKIKNKQYKHEGISEHHDHMWAQSPIFTALSFRCRLLFYTYV